MMTKKIRSNSLKWSVLGISLTSILFSLLLIFSPAVKADDFSQASAKCSDGSIVTCNGTHCTETDGKGCACTGGPNGPDVQNCPKHEEDFAMFEEDDF
jgi:hypothetical protein